MKRSTGQFKVSVIMHYDGEAPGGDERFRNDLAAVLNQTIAPAELLILTNCNYPGDPLGTIPISVIRGDFKTLGQWLETARKQAVGDYLLYLDNAGISVKLKRSYLATASLMALKYPTLGMFYADYELISDGQIKEVRLLKHHAGRLRDNQDYGRVMFFSSKALSRIGGFDCGLKYKTLYDTRLKLSEVAELVHVANKFHGSLYSVSAGSQVHNVFDYLLAGREAQIEAETVLTAHLKRIGAYLAPGVGHHKRPTPHAPYQYLASVIIPVNRRPEFISTALNSIFNQTVQAIEIIVVINGGADDPTISEVQKYLPDGELYRADLPPVRLLVADINNIGLSLDLGIQVARGQYYVQLDSDDRLKPEAIEKVLQVFNSDERIGIVIGSYEVWEKKSDGDFVRMAQIPVVTHDEWTEENGRNNLLHINGAGAPRCIPIAIIREMGYFGINDEQYARNYGEDYDLVLKISEKYRVGRVWEPIYEVVRHSGGTDHSIDQATIDRNDEAKDYMRLQAIQRRIRLNRRQARR